MRITKEFQPIVLKPCEPDSDCGCGDASCNQLAFTSDYFSFQFQNDVNFLESDTILNGDFATNDLTSWTDDGTGNAWGAGTGEACVDPESGILWQAQTLAVNRCYRLVFDLKSDIDTEGCCIEVLGYDGAAWVQLAEYCNQEAEDDIVLVICPTVAYSRIGFRFTEDTPGDCGEGTKCIDNIELRRYATTINIYDCCDDVLIDTVEYSDIIFTEDLVIVEGQWSDYVSDKSCYKFCIDDVELILNYTFATDLSDWDQDGLGDASFTWNAGRVEVVLGVNEVSDNISQEVDLSACIDEMTVNFEGLGGTFEVYINDLLFTSYTNQTGLVTIALPDYAIYRIGFRFVDTDDGGTYAINEVSISESFCSDCICVDESHSYCTMLLTSRHSEDTTDFDFETDTGFKFYLRLHSRLVNPRYPTEEELYLSSSGVSTLNYARNEKIWQYQINRVPEYIWDAVQRMFSFNNITIAGTRYVKMDGDIDPTWKRSNTKLASGIIEVKKGIDNRYTC